MNLHSGRQEILGPRRKLCELCLKEREGLSWLQNLEFFRREAVGVFVLGGRQVGGRVDLVQS